MLDLISAGLVLMMIGLGVVVVSALRGSQGGESQLKGAGVVMIGPIPIIFGSDAKWVSVAIALAALLVVLTLLAGLA
ncbi:MAG: DUF131 domain-containing protein [Thaumarchaeota archaeon]|nr:DUF131 domain-containing protein [Nitrososphaerota archaeon]